MTEKPSDCNCAFPEIMCRNMTGHAEVCPSHIRIMAEFHDTPVKLFPPLKPDPTAGIQYALDVNDKYLKRMESLLFQNGRLRSVIGEAIGFLRLMSVNAASEITMDGKDEAAINHLVGRLIGIADERPE